MIPRPGGERPVTVHRPIDGIVHDKKWPFFFLVTAWVLGSFYLVQYILKFIIGSLVAVGVPFSSFNADVLNTVFAAVVYLLLIAVIMGIPWKLKIWQPTGGYRKLIGLTRVLLWRDILFAAVGFVAYLALSTGLIMLVSSLVPGFNSNQTQDLMVSKVLSPSNAVFIFSALVIVAPVFEEIIFRGFLFGELRRTIPVLAAALVTSIVFAVVHGQWNVGIDVFALSLISCFLRYRTGSLWPSILLHMTKNGLAFYLLYIVGRNL